MRHVRRGQPGDRGGRRDGRPRRRRTRPTRAIARGRSAPSRRGGAVAPADRAGCCAGSPTSSTPTSRSSPSSRCATPGTRSATPAGRRATSATSCTYYAAAPERLFGRQIPVAGGIDVTFHEPLGVVGVIVPWNFPMPIAGWGFAPALAAGNTVVLKPAELTPLTAIRLGELALEAGLPEDVFTVLPGKGSVVGRALRHAPRRAQDRLHRLDRGRQADHGRLRRPGEAGHPRARRQERQHRLRRRRPRAGRGDARRTPSSTTPARTAAPARGSWSQRSGLRPVPGAARAGRAGRPRRGPGARRRAEMGPLISRGQRETVRVVRPGRRAGRLPRDARPTGRASGSRRPCLRRWTRATASVTRGDLRPGRRRRARSTTRPTRSGIANDTRVRPVRLDLDPRPRPRPAGLPRRSRPATCRSTSHSSVRYSTPFGGFKQSGLGRELGPDALDAFTETKNVFIATD